MTEAEFCDWLRLVLEEGDADYVATCSEDGETGVDAVRTFDEEGIMSMSKGVVVRLTDGSIFQLTVVRSR